MKTHEAQYEVWDELMGAMTRYGAMRSAHEGFSILKEEVDELWDEVRANSDMMTLRAGARQVAAMALRFMIELT